MDCISSPYKCIRAVSHGSDWHLAGCWGKPLMSSIFCFSFVPGKWWKNVIQDLSICASSAGFPSDLTRAGARTWLLWSMNSRGMRESCQRRSCGRLMGKPSLNGKPVNPDDPCMEYLPTFGSFIW